MEMKLTYEQQNETRNEYLKVTSFKKYFSKYTKNKKTQISYSMKRKLKKAMF